MGDDDRSLLREQVRTHYAAAAVRDRTSGGGCCDDDGCCTTGEDVAAQLYALDDRAAVPDAAWLASLGCGNPTAVADIEPGERVLDLGSGGGLDVLLSARRTGATGYVYGVDMTDEMLDLARRNAAEAGVANVEFRKGDIEALPLEDGAVDLVISNCVINLSVDKPAVFAEMHRVLRAGGRVGVSDIVADDGLTAAQRAARGDHVGCIAGALSFAEYREGLAAAGFEQIDITPTHEVADGMFSAIIRAVRPA